LQANATTQGSKMVVIDYVIFNTEIDMLEIRLLSLEKQVDFFIVAESRQTFSGKYKPLYYFLITYEILEYQEWKG
jgi:hypothetical protein